jgi:hypothetical protein
MASTLLDRPPVAPRTSGKPMPIKTARLQFDEDGYPDWFAIVRTNVRGSVMDDYRSGDNKRWWAAVGQIVREWNFCDEAGNQLPLPGPIPDEGAAPAGCQPGDLPEDLLSALLRKFREEFNALAQPPKASSETSTATSTTTP